MVLICSSLRIVFSIWNDTLVERGGRGQKWPAKSGQNVRMYLRRDFDAPQREQAAQSYVGESLVLVGQPRFRWAAGVSVLPTMLLIDICRVGGGVNARNRHSHEKSSIYSYFAHLWKLKRCARL